MTSYLKTISEEAYLNFLMTQEMADVMKEVYFARITKGYLGSLLGYAEIVNPGNLKTILQDGRHFLPIRSVDDSKAIILCTIDDIGVYGSAYFSRNVIRDFRDENAIVRWGPVKKLKEDRLYISYRNAVSGVFE